MFLVLQIFPVWPFSLWLRPLFALVRPHYPAAALLAVRSITWNDLFSPPPCTTPTFMSDFPILCICSLFSPLFLFLFLSLIGILFSGSQWREDGGPGFGHWCGWARWLCQYPWPAGNGAGSTTTTSQSGTPSWEEVPNNVWECSLYVREWSANESSLRVWYRRRARDGFRTAVEESSFVM